MINSFWDVIALIVCIAVGLYCVIGMLMLIVFPIFSLINFKDVPKDALGDTPIKRLFNGIKLYLMGLFVFVMLIAILNAFTGINVVQMLYKVFGI